MKLQMFVVLGLLHVCATAGASEWKSLVDDVEYAPESLTVSQRQAKGETSDVLTVWIRRPSRNSETPTQMKISGTCSDRSFHIVHAVLVDASGTKQEGATYVEYTDRPGTNSASVITAVCKLALPWWKRW